MYACSGHICNALCCCCFSYHALLSLHYETRPAKTAATKKLAQEVSNFCKRGGEMPGSWHILIWISEVGTWQAPLPIPTATDVCPCQGHWAKGVGPCYSLRPLTALAQARPECRGTCHWACGLQDYLRRDLKGIQWSIPAEKSTWSGTMWCRDRKRISTKKSLTPLKNTSIVTGRTMPSWWRKQDWRPTSTSRPDPWSKFPVQKNHAA